MFNSREAIADIIGETVVFFTIQKIWFALGRCLFLRSIHKFSWFLKSNLSSSFGHANTGTGAKKRGIAAFICFTVTLK